MRIFAWFSTFALSFFSCLLFAAPGIVRFADNSYNAKQGQRAGVVLEELVGKKNLGDKVKLEVFPPGALGNDAKVLELLQSGTIQMAAVPLQAIAKVEPKFNLSGSNSPPLAA